MTRTLRRGFALIAIGGLLVSCSSAGTPAKGPVSATLKEWEIKLSSTESGLGSDHVQHHQQRRQGARVRDPQDRSEVGLAAQELATEEVSEDARQLKEVGDPSEVAEIKPGSSDRTITVTLQPGHYVIFCNLHVEDLLHYQKGMHTDFTVS